MRLQFSRTNVEKNSTLWKIQKRHEQKSLMRVMMMK